MRLCIGSEILIWFLIEWYIISPLAGHTDSDLSWSFYKYMYVLHYLGYSAFRGFEVSVSVGGVSCHCLYDELTLLICVVGQPITLLPQLQLSWIELCWSVTSYAHTDPPSLLAPCVCECLVHRLWRSCLQSQLQTYPPNHQIFITLWLHVSAKPPKNISPNPSEVICKVLEP